MKKYSVQNKNALITGAASGIGRHLSENFARAGAHLLMGGLPAEKDALFSWAEALSHRYGVRTYPLLADLSDSKGTRDLYSQATDKVSHVHVLVNNAGVLCYGDFATMDMSGLDRMVSVNLLAYMHLMRLFLPAMVQKQDGRVLNVVSASAFQATPYHAVYGATKAFVQNMSQAVAQEIAESGVRICTLNPSYVATPMVKDHMPEKILWFSFSGLFSPQRVAAEGFNAFIKGKPICIPGWRNRLAHGVLVKAVPSQLVDFLSAKALK